MLRVAASRVPPLSLRLREGAYYFQAGVHLLWGVGKRYYTGVYSCEVFTKSDSIRYLENCNF